MGLRQLGLHRRYRTGRDHLVRDFYVPVLSNAVDYRRAVGYFSSGSLAVAGQGLNHLIERGGHVQLIASPHLQEEDIAALQRGFEARDSVVERRLLQSLIDLDDVQRRRLEYVAWMVAEGTLDIKIAMMGAARRGIFHEKIGWLSDGADGIAFTGSANETRAALLENFESISVYRGWEPAEDPWVQEIRADFDLMWANQTPELDVIPLPDALREELIAVAPASWSYAPPDPEETDLGDVTGAPMGVPAQPDGIALRDYQAEAIRAWFDAQGRGILEMATGTGKTVTALTLMTKLQRALAERHGEPLFLLVVCPFVNLVEQWRRELAQFGVRPLLGMQAAASWRPDLELICQGIGTGAMPFAAMVTTNTTLAGRAFQGLVDRLPASTLVVADEVHNLGTARLIAALPSQARYRLGLSATPQRWMDEEGTERIQGYFGPSVFELGLDEAIACGILSPYEYRPVLIQLQDEEREAYLELSAAIARLAAIGEQELSADGADGALKLLLFRRARLVGGARGKVPATMEILRQRRLESHIVVYCSDASDFDPDPDEDEIRERQIDQIVAATGRAPVSMNVRRYTYRESAAQRAAIEKDFASGFIQVLAAMRCLDEGVDIPDMRTAVLLASTTNPRQFIQRRGRVLRRAPGKQRAVIYDMVVDPGPPEDLPDDVFNIERRLFRRELLRVVQFARSAVNGVDVLHELLPLRRAWNCLDV